MKKSVYGVVVSSVLLLGQLAFSQCVVPQLPSQFKMKEKIISLSTSLKIVAPNAKLGQVTQKIFSLSRSFYYDDATGNRLASARQKIFAWGVHIDVVDCQGRKIGTIKEQIWKSLLKVVTTYSILDAYDRQIATSEKMDWFSTDFTLRDPTGRVVATLHRPFINFLSDTWTVNVVDASVVDPRLLVMISAYKTSVDNERRREAAQRSSDNNRH